MTPEDAPAPVVPVDDDGSEATATGDRLDPDADLGGEDVPDGGATTATSPPPAPEAVESWHLVSVVDVRLELPATNPEVVLQETTAPWRELRIPVGLAEGNAIAHGLRQVATARPLSHALFAEILERQGVEIEAARITARQGRLFAAELETTGPRGRQVVACRPSDAIALLLRRRMPTPLLVGEWVFDNAPGGPS